MPFHRLTVPAYTGGLPAGYDYVNNALAGTPAPADGSAAGGPNAGTYFVGFGDATTTLNANRPHSALAENTDFLDNLFRRDLAIPTRTDDVTAGAPVTSITITGPAVFVGPPGTPNTVAGINTFVELTDENDAEIVDASQTPCRITAIAGATPGDGFSTGDIVLTISPAIPSGKTYRVYFALRGNLATLPMDALTFIKIRGAEVVSAELEALSGATLIGLDTTTLTWFDATTLSALTVFQGFSDLMTKLSTVSDAKLGVGSQSGSPYALSSGSLGSQLSFLLGGLNDQFTTRTITGNDSIAGSDKTLILNAASSTLALPAPSTHTGQEWRLADKSGTLTIGAGVTLVRSAAEKIDGVAADYELNTPGGRWLLTTDGTDWYLFSC